MAIYLALPSPAKSSDLPGGRRAALCLLFGLASDGVYMCPVCYQPGGSLLHCPSTLTGAGTKCRSSGIFLLHCPWSRLHQTLSGILPCEARTFLTCSLSVLQPRPFVLLKTLQVYHIFLLLSRDLVEMRGRLCKTADGVVGGVYESSVPVYRLW